MIYRFGPFELDAGAAHLVGPDGLLAVRPMSLKLLQVLLDAAPDVVSHEELLDRVWRRQEVSPGVVSQSVRELRKALGDPAQSAVYIETRHRLGYRFMAPVERCTREQTVAPDAPPAAPVATDTTAPAAVQRHQFGRWSWLAMAAALIVMAVMWWPQGAGTPEPAFLPIDVGRSGRPAEPEARAWFDRGVEALRERRFDLARELLGKAQAREPSAPATLATLAALHAEHGEMQRAQGLSAAALAAGAALARPERLRLEALDAALHYRWEVAVDNYHAAFQLDPGDSNVGMSLFRAQLAAGRSADAARTLDFLTALPEARLDPAQIDLARARLAGLGGSQSERLDAAEQAERNGKDPRTRLEAQMEAIAALTLMGQHERARSLIAAAAVALAADAWPAGAQRLAMLQGSLARETSAFDAAIAHYQTAAHAADALGDARGAAAARREAAYALVLAGKAPEAVAEVTALLPEQQARGDLRELAGSLNVLSVAQQRVGDQDAARTSGERALSLYLETGDVAGEAAARNNLGMLFGRLGRSSDAEAQLEQALPAFRNSGNRRGAAVALSNLAILYGAAGRSEAAREANETALAEFRAVDARLDVARLQFNLGIQDRRGGKLDAAQKRLSEALAGFQALGAADFEFACRASLGELLLLRADLSGAAAVLDYAERSEQIAPQRLAALHSAEGRRHLYQGAFDRAQQRFQSALELRQQAGLAAWVRISELDLTELGARSGDLIAAELKARSLRRDLLDAGEGADAARAGLLLAAILSASDQREAALRLLDELEPTVRSDVLLGLQLDLVRAHARPADRRPALLDVAARAREVGFERLALQAELLHGGQSAERAAMALRERGLQSMAGSLVLPL